MDEQKGPIFGVQARRLGQQRLDAFIKGHAEVQAMAMFLVMSAMTAPTAGYSDDALDALTQDARDVRDAADRWATGCEALGAEWRKQRRELLPEDSVKLSETQPLIDYWADRHDGFDRKMLERAIPAAIDALYANREADGNMHSAGAAVAIATLLAAGVKGV